MNSDPPLFRISIRPSTNMGNGRCKSVCKTHCTAYNGVAQPGRKCNDCRHGYETHKDEVPRSKSASKSAKKPAILDDDDDDDEQEEALAGPAAAASDEDQSSDGNNSDLIERILSKETIQLKPTSLKRSTKHLLASKAEVSVGVSGSRRTRGLDLIDKLDSAASETLKERKKVGPLLLLQLVADR